jgi:hypothetical protein
MTLQVAARGYTRPDNTCNLHREIVHLLLVTTGQFISFIRKDLRKET